MNHKIELSQQEMNIIVKALVVYEDSFGKSKIHLSMSDLNYKRNINFLMNRIADIKDYIDDQIAAYVDVKMGR